MIKLYDKRMQSLMGAVTLISKKSNMYYSDASGANAVSSLMGSRYCKTNLELFAFLSH
jgi:hypothetical protein